MIDDDRYITHKNLIDNPLTLPNGSWFSYTPISTDNTVSITTDGCFHEYVNVGFRFDKFVCKKCDCEKK
jgi:hypothetical protein